MLTYILFIIGFVLLIKGADLLVDGASSIAKKLKISTIVIGLTIVALGTSTPELIVNIFASASENTDIAIGNVVGSNILSIFWILGVSSIIRPLPFSVNSRVDILMTIFASLLLFIIMFIGKKHTVERWQGALMIVIYIGYISFLIIGK